MLHLRLLGKPELQVSGQSLTLPPKRLALTAFLALSGEVRRVQVADLFWDEGNDEVTRRNLRQELHRMKGAGLGEYLTLTPDTLGLRDFSCDVLDFLSGSVETALSLYRGPLLDGLEVPHAARFMEWLEGQREALHTRWLELRRTQAVNLEGTERWAEALDMLSPLLGGSDEAAAAQAIRLHTRLGQFRAAQDVFERTRKHLTDIGLEPSAELVTLYARLRGETTQTPRSTGRATLDRPPLVGREALLNTILDELMEGNRIILLEGEPGSGKTTLAAEAVHRWGGGLCLQGQEGAAHLPFLPLIEAFREHLPALRELPQAVQAELSRLLPELSPLVAPPTDLHGEGRSRFLSALADALRALMPGRVLLLEDLHWVDESTLEVLTVLRRPGDAWAGLATMRPLEGESHPAVNRFLTQLEERGRLARHAVLPLTETDTLRLIRSLAPPGTTGTRFARRLFQSTGGNPLFLLETLRTLFANGDLREEGGQWHTAFDTDDSDYRELPLPATVTAAVQARLVRLAGQGGGALTHLLGAAALLGQDFSAEELQSSTPLGDWELLEALEQALTAGLLIRQEGGRYRFAHALVQRSVLESLTPERRRFLHRRLAATLSTLGAPAARLAPQLEGSGQSAEAAQAWLTAAGDAAHMYAHRETLAHLHRALSLGLEAETARQTHLRAAEVQRTLDNKAGWREELNAARTLAPVGDSDLLLRFMELNFYSGHFEDVLNAAETLPSALSAEQRGWASLWEGNAYSRLGRMNEALSTYARAAQHAAAGADKLLGRLLNAWAYAASESGDLDLAHKKVTEALEAFERAGHVSGQVMARNTAGTVAYLRSDLPEAIHCYQDSHRLSVVIGDKASQRLALANLAGVYIKAGDYDHALETVNAALELLAEVPDIYSEGLLLERLYFVHEHRGQHQRSYDTLLRWMAHADQHGFRKWSVDSRLNACEWLCEHRPPNAQADALHFLTEVEGHLPELPDEQRLYREGVAQRIRVELDQVTPK